MSISKKKTNGKKPLEKKLKSAVLEENNFT